MNSTLHVECDVSSMSRRRVITHHKRRKFTFDRLLHIIFFITDTERVRFVLVNGEASRVKPFKKNVEKKFWRKNSVKKCGKKIL